MIQLRVSELLWKLFLKRNVEADDLKSGVRSMYVDKLGSESCPARIRVLSLSEIPKIIPCDRLWVPATQSKGMHVRRTFCGIRSGPNVTTGVVSMQRSHTSDLVRFS